MKHLSIHAALTVAVIACRGYPAAGFTLEGPGGSMTIDSRIQAAYARDLPGETESGEPPPGDGASGQAEAGDEGAGANRFYVQQARLNLHGTYHDRFTYRLTAELGNSTVPLRDACIGVRFAPWFKTEIGQFKVPYSFERLTSGADLLFAWRPDMADALVPGRDIGVMGDLEGPRHHIRFRAGVFTGRGQNMVMDDARGRPLWAARVDWTPLEPMWSRKNPTVRSGRPALVLGVNAAFSDDGEVGPDGPIDSIDGQKRLIGADLAIAYRGLWMSLEGNLAHFTPRDSSESPYQAAGYLVQFGWYLPRLRVEPAVRYDELDPDNSVDGDLERTLTLGVNAYPTRDGHVKLMFDYAHRFPADGGSGEGWDEDTLRVLVQFVLS